MKNRVFRAYFVTCVTLACQVAAVYFESVILHIMWNSSRQFRQDKRPVCHLSVRLAVFTAYSFVTLIVSLLITFSPKIMGLYVFLASLPFAAFLIFGTQRENLFAWFGSCFPALGNTYANALARRRGIPKRTATIDSEIQLTSVAVRAFAIDAGFTNPDISTILDKRLPKTPTVTDEM